MDNTLITLKNITKPVKLGGVGVYYKTLRAHLPEHVRYFHYTSEIGQNSIKLILSALKDISLFATHCRKKKGGYKLVHLNPSLDSAGVVRDGIMLLVAKLHKKKTLVFFRGWHQKTEQRIDNNRVIRWLFCKVYHQADAVVVLSSGFREKLLKWGFGQNIYIETTTFDATLLTQHNPIHRVTSDATINLLFMSRVERSKGIFNLLEAFEILQQKRQDIRLNIAGVGRQLGEAKKFAATKGLNNVHFVGHVFGGKKAELLQNSDIFVFPTAHGEGMPNAVLEAMAFGLPVITRPVGGLKDFFKEGEMGYLTDSLAPNTLADLIERLIMNKDTRQKMAAYNAAYAKQYFASDVVAERLLRIHHEVLNNITTDRTWFPGNAAAVL